MEFNQSTTGQPPIGLMTEGCRCLSWKLSAIALGLVLLTALAVSLARVPDLDRLQLEAGLAELTGAETSIGLLVSARDHEPIRVHGLELALPDGLQIIAQRAQLPGRLSGPMLPGLDPAQVRQACAAMNFGIDSLRQGLSELVMTRDYRTGARIPIRLEGSLWSGQEPGETTKLHLSRLDIQMPGPNRMCWHAKSADGTFSLNGCTESLNDTAVVNGEISFHNMRLGLDQTGAITSTGLLGSSLSGSASFRMDTPDTEWIGYMENANMTLSYSDRKENIQIDRLESTVRPAIPPHQYGQRMINPVPAAFLIEGEFLRTRATQD